MTHALKSESEFEVVIVEDSIPTSVLYKSYLESEGYNTRVFHSGLEALDYLIESQPAVLIQDVQLPDINGLDIVSKLVDKQLPTQIIVVTGEGSVDTAVEAMRRGSFDFIEKPFTKERLLVTVANAIKQKALLEQVEIYQEEIDLQKYHDFVGRSLPMQLVYRIIDNAAQSKASIFVTGESGTGKELCALAVHKSSSRAEGPFIAINCAAIPRELFESEIFGHVKGAFSGATTDRKGAAEQADGGTLFLDELCEMDIDLQAKLLRFIQTGTFQKVGSTSNLTVDVRFVCATNRDPLLEVSEGRFREDLYYRLNVVPISLPPLRERESDVLQIAQTLLTSFSRELNKSFVRFSPDIEKAFLKHSWPGNVRELRNVIENTVIMNSGETVEFEMLPDTFKSALNSESAVVTKAKPAAPQPAASVSTPMDGQIQPLWLTEKQAIEHAINHCDGNIPVAAAMLGVSASTIYRKIKSWDAEAG